MEWLYVLGSVYSLIFVIVHGVEQLSFDFLVFFSHMFFLTTAVVACIASLILVEAVIRKVWLFLAMGMILNVASSFLFSHTEPRVSCREGHRFELLWFWSLVAVFVGSYIPGKEF